MFGLNTPIVDSDCLLGTGLIVNYIVSK